MSIPPEEANFPSGNRLKAEYKNYPGGREMSGAGPSMTAAAIDASASADISAVLPDGFSLGESSVVRIMGVESIPKSLAKNRTSAPVKATFSALYPLAYKDVEPY